ERLCEVLSKKVRSTSLKSFSITHHCFDAISSNGTGKALPLCLFSGQNWQSQPLLGQLLVVSENQPRLALCFVAGCMGSMSFLPEKFSCSKEQSGSHFPANHICPLVDEDRQVSPGLNPLSEHIVDNRL